MENQHLHQRLKKYIERIRGAELLFLVFNMDAFTVNISQHLEDAPKFLKIGEGDKNVFKVDDRKNTVLKIQEIVNKDSGITGMDKAIELALGKEALKKINEMDLTMSAYQNIFIGMMAAISSQTFEEAEKQFRDSK